jgi:hypothetical protein
LVLPGQVTPEFFAEVERVKMDALEVCIHYLPWTITTVVHGDARGIDKLSGLWAQKHGVPCEVFKADWVDRGAGLRRNEEMAEVSDAVLAIWDGESKGTLHMIKTARKRGMQLAVFKFHWVHDE